MTRFLSVLIAALACFGTLNATESYAIVPTPAKYTQCKGSYTLKSTDAARVAKMRTDKAMPDEAYALDITPEKVTITAGSDAGRFYGLQTLQQIIDQASDGTISCLSISDMPRYGYRGVMLDVVRCFYPVNEIKRLIDAAAMLKLNTLHLHLTDDNGWRMEIKQYPRLTSVGAWRVDRPEIFPGRLNARSADEPATYGGYYTQRELRDLVKYAAKRHITIIPEIEMPAHSAAAIAAYPDLACPVVDKFVGVFPGIGGKDASIIMCAGNDDVYTFYQRIIDEVIDVFPSEYIHLGGDEANKAVWEKCPLCNQRIADEGLKDHEELQAYFMDRINHYVHSKGRKTIGWDEVTYGNPKEDMVIMGWQGDGGVAVRDAIKTGRKFIMTPAKVTYLIRYQGPQWFEPFTYFGNNTLKDIYDYSPLSPENEVKVGDQLLGVQGSLWSEFCKDATDMQYLVFPRLMAVADVAWRSADSSRDWMTFLHGVDALLPRLDAMGITYARSMYNLDHKVTAANGRLNVSLDCIRPDVEIRYSIGDSTYNNIYTSPIVIDNNATIYATTFRGGEKTGRTLVLPLSINKATTCDVNATECRNGLAYTLTNGLRGSDRCSDSEWAGWHNSTCEFTIDLGEDKPISEVTLGNLVHSDICVCAPKAIYVYVSANNNSFDMVKAIDIPDDIVFHKSAKIFNHTTGPVDTHGRYVKVVAINPGCIPDGFAREGTPTWMYFDEIIIK